MTVQLTLLTKFRRHPLDNFKFQCSSVALHGLGYSLVETRNTFDEDYERAGVRSKAPKIEVEKWGVGSWLQARRTERGKRRILQARSV